MKLLPSTSSRMYSSFATWIEEHRSAASVSVCTHHGHRLASSATIRNDIAYRRRLHPLFDVLGNLGRLNLHDARGCFNDDIVRDRLDLHVNNVSRRLRLVRIQYEYQGYRSPWVVVPSRRVYRRPWKSPPSYCSYWRRPSCCQWWVRPLRSERVTDPCQ